MLKVSLLAAAAAVLVASPLSARPMTARDMHSMHRLGAPEVSRDGRYAVFTVSRTDWDKNKRVNTLYLLDLTRAGTTPQPVRGAEKGHDAAFGPDGSLWFLMPIGEHDQLFRMAIGGVNETTATVFYAILFVFCLTKAFIHIRRREIVLHREWMIRGFAIGLGVATVRPIVGAFFAARRLSPHEFFGTAFWLGFTINLIAAEAWINYTRGRPIPEQTLVLSELSTTVE